MIGADPWQLRRYWPVLVVLLIRVAAIIVWLIGSTSDTGLSQPSRWPPLLDLLLLAWVVYGWWLTRKWYLGWLVVLLAVLCLADGLWVVGRVGSAIAVFGMACMAMTFAGCLWLARLALSPGIVVLSVARTVLEQAVRMKVALGFIIGMVLLVPVLPTLLDQENRLSYRMQMFLEMGLSGSVWMLSLLTVFLACGTICHDMTGRQVYLTMTKPVSRLEYLLGKWLGVVMLNLILVCVIGGGVYVFARSIQQQPYYHHPTDAPKTRQQIAQQQEDEQRIVRQQVLTAREAVAPQHPSEGELARLFDQRLARLKLETPTKYGQPLSPDISQAIDRAVRAQWHTIAPLDSKTYLFTGLSHARNPGQSAQLRITPRAARTPPDELVHLVLEFNGADHHPARTVTLADGLTHLIDLSYVDANGDRRSYIDDQGRLEVTIINRHADNPQRTFTTGVTFPPGQGLQVLFQSSGFGANLARAMALIWVRLAYLAMLGLATGTFLSFPVASLMTLLIYFAAATSGFLTESMQSYVTFPGESQGWWPLITGIWERISTSLSENQFGDALRVVIRLVGQCFVALIPSFSRFDPVPLVSDGRLVDYGLVGSALWRVGFVWTGGCAVVGWLIFRRRELAGVTV